MSNDRTLCTLPFLGRVGAEGEAMTNLNNKKWFEYIKLSPLLLQEQDSKLVPSYLYPKYSMILSPQLQEKYTKLLTLDTYSLHLHLRRLFSCIENSAGITHFCELLSIELGYERDRDRRAELKRVLFELHLNGGVSNE